MMYPLQKILFCLSCFVLLQSTAHAYEALDAIKIVVNKDVITLNEYRQRLDETRVNLRNQGQNVPEQEMAKEVAEETQEEVDDE